MENLVVKLTPHTPEILFKTDGELTIKGVSIPENTFAFYAEAMEWVKALENNQPNTITLNLEFEYLNTASNRSIIDLISIIENYKKKGTTFNINWIYEEEDEDALELGQDIEFCVETKFKYVPVFSEK